MFLLAASRVARGQSPISFDALPRASKVAKPDSQPKRPAPTTSSVLKDSIATLNRALAGRTHTQLVIHTDTVSVVRVDTVHVSVSNGAVALEKPKAVAPKARAEAITFSTPSVSGLLQIQLTGGDAAALKSTYRVRRAEVKVVSDLGRKSTATLMIDVSKALSLATSGTTTSVTQSSRALQDAILSVPLKRVTFDLGQQRLPLGYEGSHSSSTLETIDRALMESDRARGGAFGDVRDLGLAAKGKWRWLEYKGGVFNGSGETMNETDRNVGKAIVGQLALRPTFVPGLRVGSSAATSGAAAGDKPVRDRVGAELLYLRGPIHVQAEAMGGQDGAIRREGMYALAGYNVTKSIKLLTRFDAWDPNTGSEGAASDVTERDYLAGVTWLPSATRLKLQLAVVRKTWTADVTPAVTQVLTQLQASW